MSRRSSVDLFGNTTEIPSLNNVEVFAELLENRRYPTFAMASFLHETTHHWCFDSPVCSALALTRLRAYHYQSIKASGAAWDHLSGYRTVERLLHPIAEGMALFAEFDLLTTPSSTISSTVTATAVLFFRNTRATTGPVPFHRVMNDFRRGNHALAVRKSSILTSPLSADGDGYLLGYLAVKSAWRTCAKRCPSLADADLFLMFLRSYLFADHGLVNLLLPGSGKPLDHSAIISHIRKRFQVLPSLDLAHLIDRFIDDTESFAPSTSNPQGGESTPWDPPSVVERGRRVLAQEIGQASGGLDLGSEFSGLAYYFYATRTVMNIGCLDVLVQTRGSTVRVVSGNMLIATATLREPQRAREEQGCMRLFLLPKYSVHVMTLEVNGKTLRVDVLGKMPDGTDVKELESLVQCSTNVDESCVRLDATIDGFLQQNYQLCGSLDQRNTAVAQDLYLTFVFGTAHPEEILLTAMASTGLFRILGEDAETVHQVALISLLASVEPEISTMANECRKLGFETHDHLTRLRQASKLLGLQIVDDSAPLRHLFHV